MNAKKLQTLCEAVAFILERTPHHVGQSGDERRAADFKRSDLLRALREVEAPRKPRTPAGRRKAKS